jgi:S1-C subfamily serine protease
MQENESDGDGGWPRPDEYVSPWAPRDEGEPAGTNWPAANAAPPPENGNQDTIAFGTPPGSSGSDGQGSRVPPSYGGQSGYGNAAGYGGQSGYGNAAGYAQAWPGTQPGYGNQAGRESQDRYGSQDGYRPQSGFGSQDGYRPQSGFGSQDGYRPQSGFGSQDGYQGQAGYQSQGSGEDPGRQQAGGGYGTPGWALPDPPPGRPGRGGRFLVYLAVAVLAAGTAAGVTVALGHNNNPAPAAGISSNQVPGPHDNAAGSGSSSAPLNRRAVEKEVLPGLVDIVSTIKYNSETAEGTGMIISSGGLVLTNNHVIDGETAIRVTLLAPGRNPAQYTAQVVGYDVTDDVALLQLQGASGLPTERFGNSSQVTLGTPVLALGNAEGRGKATPAAGIINALDRSIQASDEGSDSTENLNHMLQTDARIQQGDSGGALANKAGQVIGMITAANTSSGQGSGSGGTLGFAIPINSALTIARQIASDRPSATVSIGLPGFLGVEVATSSSDNPQQQASDAQQSGIGRAPAGSGPSCQNSNQGGVPTGVAPIAAGALILGVLCNTAATSAGMVAGDVITSVAGQPVTTPGSLTGITAKYHPGDIVTVIWVSLDGVEHTTLMKLGPGPAR